MTSFNLQVKTTKIISFKNDGFPILEIPPPNITSLKKNKNVTILKNKFSKL